MRCELSAADDAILGDRMLLEVVDRMLLRRHDLQIFRAVINRVVVPVVNNLSRLQRTTDNIHHHGAVHGDMLAAARRVSIPRRYRVDAPVVGTGSGAIHCPSELSWRQVQSKQASAPWADFLLSRRRPVFYSTLLAAKRRH